MIEARAPQYLQNPDAQQGTIPDTAGLPVNGLRDALHATMSPELTQLDLIQRAESMLGVQVAKTLIERAGRVDPDGTRWTSVTALTDPTNDILGAVQIPADKQAAPSSFARFIYSPRLLPPDAAAQFNDLTVKIDAARNYAAERGAKTGRRHRASEDTIAKLEEQRAGLIARGISAYFGAGDGKPPGNTDELETVPLAGTGLIASMVAISTARSGSAEPTKSRRNRTLGTAAAALMASAFMSACGGAGGEAPAATPRVTTYPTATAIRPTEAPPTATFTAIPPTATIEASRTPAPRPTPDKSISPVKLEANVSMAQELTKTVAGKVLLNRVIDLADIIKSTPENVLANLEISYSTDPATGDKKYAFANVKGGGFGPLSTTVGLDAGAFVAGDLMFKSKQTDLQNNQYPEMDVDGKLLIVSTGRASAVAGVNVVKVQPNVFTRKFVAFAADGSVVAEASMDISSSPIKNNKDEPLPDWKAVWSVLPAPTAEAGITGTPGSSGGPEPTTQAPAEKTSTPAATQAAETVKPTGAYKEANGSIVWTSFENARDTITPPVIPGLKAQLKGETVVYVDATGKEVGQFNPEVTFSENGAVKRLGAVLFDRDSQKLKEAIGDKMPFPFPLNVRVRMKNLVTKQGTPMTLYGCDGQIDPENFYAGQTNGMTFATTSLGFTRFGKNSNNVGALAYAQLGFATQPETQWNTSSIPQNQLDAIRALCREKIDNTASMFQGIDSGEFSGFNAQFRYADLAQGAKLKNDFAPYSRLGGSFVGAR